MRIERRIIFFDAKWSGPSQIARKAAEAFNNGRSARVNIEFIDLDGDELMQLRENVPDGIHGWGEVVVVEDNQIIFSARLGNPLAETQQKIQALFAEYDSLSC